MCARIQEALSYGKNSVAIPGIVVTDGGIKTFKNIYGPMLLSGGFRFKCVNVPRHNKIYVVLSWDKGLT